MIVPSTLPVTFVLLGGDSLPQLEQLQPDSDWHEVLNGMRAWILQTYLRLRDRGLHVRLSADLPPDGIAPPVDADPIDLRRLIVKHSGTKIPAGFDDRSIGIVTHRGTGLCNCIQMRW